MSHKMLGLSIAGYLLGVILLFFYSFTQVDLSLTLSQVSLWQEVQKSLQYIGYFNRPLSAYLYIGIISLLFISYLSLLHLANKGVVSLALFWKITIFSVVILAFSYNAFSYDLFNYIFDAKIVTAYQQNPYEHKALDYAGDPMLSFMRWTHRVYPYGPTWLLVTIPLSYLGMGYFLVTFFLFKFLMAGSFLGSLYFAQKILKKIDYKKSVFALLFFALNPLVIIESVVSSHNDSVMIFFALLSVYLLLERRYIGSVIGILLSIGVKFATVFMLPAYAYLMFTSFSKKQSNKDIFFGLLLGFMSLAVVVVSIRTNFQPWYLLIALPFGIFLSQKYYVVIPFVVLSFLALFQYVPYLYLGNWDPPVPSILFSLLIGSIILSAVLVGMFKITKQKDR